MKDSSQPTNQAPTEEEVILTLGYASFEAQETEATLHLAMSVILKLSIAESIEHLKLIYSKKTLGQLLTLVRKEIGIDPSFDTFITDYIEQRNFIIHNISRCSGFSLFTDDGRQKLMNFLTRFRYINRKVKMTFVALTEAWLEILFQELNMTKNLKTSMDLICIRRSSMTSFRSLEEYLVRKT